MEEPLKESFLKMIYATPPRILKKPHLNELVRVYEDLEKTLRELKATYAKHDGTFPQINMHKLISQLSRSKRKLERKIGNTILLEKQQLKRKIRQLTSNLGHQRRLPS